MNKLKMLIGFWILIALVGLGAFAYAVKKEMSDEAVPEQAEWKTYADPSGSVSLSYPDFAEAKPVQAGLTQEWNVRAASASGTLLADIRIPKSYQPGTNWSEARFTIGRSADPDEIKNCTVVQDNFSEREEAEIDGYPFMKTSLADAGAGNFYETTSYRGIFDGDCYIIEHTIHSTNIGNYPAELGIEEFDKAKAAALLEDMVESVRFLISSD